MASIFKSAGCKGISFVAAKKLILNVSERTGMSVVPRRSDVFASQKLASRSVHGCTLLDRLFQKAYEKLYTTCGYWESSTYQKRHGCRWFQAESSSHRELAAKECTGGTFFSVPAVLFCLIPCIYTVYFKRLTENMFSKAVEVCASTPCFTKKKTNFIIFDGTLIDVIYFSSISIFQSLIVLVSSLKLLPISTIFFLSVLYFAA